MTLFGENRVNIEREPGWGWLGRQPGAPMGCTLDRVKNVESMMLVSVSSLESPNIDVFEMF